ncbi:F-box/kelch-repeat protein At1g22040 isoform X2 [Phalaenopsis equestris]|uniref:F-box/kelch-repeat protein At1g22040 isoform X2 n=1 Tax=Phalaenopsis equestris TaxID=78828 RepID=UPI0009E1F547|nr:F-box/kelch-repeat protein At1g22040 isoform X2 [Phalaenopsis equestris]XP_020586690.1 F-box/kelch-repeat protein At1g22040 isoform X2 [Phalaenopsis equestris]XP_020586691.1 F-box/kelch-repeat protein At1g22040 isoform X2 [Phalaenopsis equestris]XP_020586692.1 F-box/kelch-repeat protein At1g22040 isoform X2 [Phalaenopsis equestris]
MGSFLSFPVTKSQEKLCSEVSQTEVSSKRLKLSSSFSNENPRLIPSLPDEISHQILARIPRIYYLGMKLVSRSWKAAITSAEIYQIRKELRTTEEWLYILMKAEEDKLCWHALDPSAGKWQRLPPMPNLVCEEKSKRGISGFLMCNMMDSSIRIADVILGWLGRKDVFERLPFCGCAIGTVDGCLYVLGGFSRAFAMKCVWRYDPVVNMWEEVSSMTTGRAFCKASLLNDKLYVVGGVCKGRGGLTPLQSAEVYDPKTGFWTEVKKMPFSKAQTLPTAFLAELLKPIATGMTTYRGKLCVPQSLYSWPFFVDVGGEIYDPETDLWADMPAGMGEGWPARQVGTKLSVVVNGELYALEPSSSLDCGKIKIYDHQEDAWKVVFDKVPVLNFTDADSPNLLAGFSGTLHLITKNADNGTAIWQADLKKQICSRKNESFFGASTSSESHVSSEAEADVWKVIAVKNFGAAELASCLVLDI